MLSTALDRPRLHSTAFDNSPSSPPHPSSPQGAAPSAPRPPAASTASGGVSGVPVMRRGCGASCGEFPAAERRESPSNGLVAALHGPEPRERRPRGRKCRGGTGGRRRGSATLPVAARAESGIQRGWAARNAAAARTKNPTRESPREGFEFRGWRVHRRPSPRPRFRAHHPPRPTTRPPSPAP
jgi:hypothetical protein